VVQGSELFARTLAAVLPPQSAYRTALVTRPRRVEREEDAVSTAHGLTEGIFASTRCAEDTALWLP
jgi:hypothetical protein